MSGAVPVAQEPGALTQATGIRGKGAGIVDMKLEVVVLPVSDVDRAKEFYGGLGWRLYGDLARRIRPCLGPFTAPGSARSIQFGTSIASGASGSAQGLYLAVSDIEAAREQLLAHGVEV